MRRLVQAVALTCVSSAAMAVDPPRPEVVKQAVSDTVAASLMRRGYGETNPLIQKTIDQTSAEMTDRINNAAQNLSNFANAQWKEILKELQDIMPWPFAIGRPGCSWSSGFCGGGGGSFGGGGATGTFP